MDDTAILARQIYEQTLDLSTTSLLELGKYVEFLRFRTRARQSVQERLARDYDELAAMYDELADELADDVWLSLENEALLHVEKDANV